MGKTDSFAKILISVLFVGLSLAGVAILYKGATTNDSADLRSRAAEYKDVLVKEWEFKKDTENWIGVGTIKVDQADGALRGKLLEAYGVNGQIINSSVNEKMSQGLKYLKFSLALRRPVAVRTTPDRGYCTQIQITCPDGKKQPAFTPECNPNPCPRVNPKSEADCNKYRATSEYCNNQPSCQYDETDKACHYRPQRIPTGGGAISPIPCPQDTRTCPDGTKVKRIRTGNGCQFQECPASRTPTPSVYNLVVQYAVDNQWVSQTVKVVPGESYKEFSVQLPLRAMTIQKIRFIVPVSAFQYTFWFDWVKLWSKVVIPPTPTNTPTPKPTATPTPTPPCLPLPSCVYVGAVDSRGSIVYCTPPPPPKGRVYCPRPTVTPTPTLRFVVPTIVSIDGCVKAGCSSELCMDQARVAKEGNSPCYYLPSYQCLSKSRCERQADGRCGWTETTEYKSCMAKLITPTPASEADCNQYKEERLCRMYSTCSWRVDNVCRFAPQRYNTYPGAGQAGPMQP